MKIIKQGQNIKPWWLGRRMECRLCHQIIEIEREDDRRAEFCVTPSYVQYRCTNCDELNTMTAKG